MKFVSGNQSSTVASDKPKLKIRAVGEAVEAWYYENQTLIKAKVVRDGETFKLGEEQKVMQNN